MIPSSSLETAWSTLKKEDIFRRRPILGNRILTPVFSMPSSKPTPKPTPDPPPEPSLEPSPMDLAMEEIRAAQRQREEQARKFEEMMSGSFAAAFPQNISQEMADMIAAFKLQGMSDEQATNIARHKLGE